MAEGQAGLDWRVVREGDLVRPLEANAGHLNVLKFLGATWHFMPLFYDLNVARGRGLAGPLVPGPMKLALLSRMLEEWLDGAGRVRSIRSANRRPDLHGHLRLGGSVLRRYEQEGERLIDCEIWIENERGERSTAGAATLALD